MPFEIFLPEVVRDMPWLSHIFSHVFWCPSALWKTCVNMSRRRVCSGMETQSKLTVPGPWPALLTSSSHPIMPTNWAKQLSTWSECIADAPSQLSLGVDGVVVISRGPWTGPLAAHPSPFKNHHSPDPVSPLGKSRDSVSLICTGGSTALMNWLMLTKVTTCTYDQRARTKWDKTHKRLL